MTAKLPDPLPQIVAEQRALAILRLLKGILRGAGNEDLLAKLLSALGFRHSREVLLQDLERLERLGLVKLDKVESLVVMELTLTGSEVAQGLADAEGVAKPDPECPY